MDYNKDLSSPYHIEDPRAWEEQQSAWEVQQQQIEKERQARFKKLGAITLLYALFYTFCMYQNVNGITMPLWIAGTILYASRVLKQYEIKQKKDGAFHIIAMILLGISTFLTGNEYVIALNYMGFFLLLVSLLLHSMYEDKEWGIGTYLFMFLFSIFGAMGKLNLPFLDAHSFRKLHQKRDNKKLCCILFGFLMAVPSSILLATLLGSADAVFKNLLTKSLRLSILPSDWFGVLLLFTFAFLSAYCGISQLVAHSKTAHTTLPITQKIPSIVTIGFISPITLLYVLFSLVQVFYLFLGAGTLPDGISYADYARTGFFQLLFVCMLNFVFVLFVQNCVEESNVLRGILLAICGCTFIMIASSAYRMLLYIGVYQLTFLRIFVLMALLVIAFLMVGVVILLFKINFQIYKYSLIIVSSIYLVFSFAHVDYFIASYNLSHVEDSKLRNTLEYVSTLSTDAAPAIANYMDGHQELSKMLTSLYDNKSLWEGEKIYGIDDDVSWYLWYMRKVGYFSQNSSLREFNVSHYIAAKVMNA